MNTAKERSVDEYLGFLKKAASKNEEAPEAVEPSEEDGGAYEDSWYQVLKAKTGETDDV